MNTALAAADHVRADDSVAAGLARCEDLLARHLDAVARRFGAASLGVIDLPALGPEPIVGAQVRASAALFWCRELELAGVLPVVEHLAATLERGEDGLMLTRSAWLFRPFGARATDRFVASEREALFGRVFPAGTFDAQLDRLVAALDAIGRAGPLESLVPLRVRVGVLALDLGRRLSDSGVGVTAFAARDIVEQIRDALTVLADAEVARSLGGGRPLELVARHGARILGRPLDLEAHVARAHHGVDILRWIADVAPEVQAAARDLGPTDAVVIAGQAVHAWPTRGAGS